MKKVDGVAASCGNAIYIEMTDVEAEDLAGLLNDDDLQEALEKDIQSVRHGLEPQQIVIKVIRSDEKDDQDEEDELARDEEDDPPPPPPRKAPSKPTRDLPRRK
jgi:hypothetical protein